MPKDSKYRSSFKRKIQRIPRKDGEVRYRVNLPKRLVESVKHGHLCYGSFELDPLTDSIIFWIDNDRKKEN